MVLEVLCVPQTLSPVLGQKGAQSGVHFMGQDKIVPTFLKPFLLPKISVSYLGRKKEGI